MRHVRQWMKCSMGGVFVALAVACGGAEAVRGADTTSAQEAQAGQALEKRLDRLESLEQIRQLKHTYAKYCDENYNPEKLKTLFWDDAVWDAGPQFGEHKGPEAIGAFFAKISGSFLWARHYVVNERIELSEDGNSARGEWQIIEPLTLKSESGPEASWLIAQYNDVYTRRDGVWKFQRLQADINFMVPHAKGWAEATAPKQ